MNYMSIRWSSKKWKWTLIGLVLILTSALFLRLFRLNLIPVFADEAIYVRWAQVMRVEPSLRFLPLSDGKQPLFMWGVIPFLKLIADPLTAGRVVSIITGLGTTVGVFVLTMTLFNSRKASLLASLLYALSPFAVFFDRMALVDSMLSFFGVWSLTFAILAMRRTDLGLAFLSGSALGGALLTKSPALFFVLFLPASLIFIPFKTKKRRVVNLLKGFGLLGAVLIVAIVMYNILRLGENFHMIGIRNYDYVYPFGHLLELPFDPFVSHVNRALEWFETMGPAGLLVLTTIGTVVNLPKFKKEIFILLLWGVVPVLVQAEFAKVFTSRYIFFSLPPLVVLAASVLKRIKKPPYVYGVYTLVVFFFIQIVLFYVPFFYDPTKADWPERDGYLADWTAGTGIKNAAALVKEKRDANPSKQIVVGTEGYFGTLPDGLQIYLEREPNIVVIGVGLDLKEVPKSLAESADAGNVTYLVANSSRLSFIRPYEEYGLRVVAQYEKAERENGEQDVFYVFEVVSETL